MEDITRVAVNMAKLCARKQNPMWVYIQDFVLLFVFGGYKEDGKLKSLWASYWDLGCFEVWLGLQMSFRPKGAKLAMAVSFILVNR